MNCVIDLTNDRECMKKIEQLAGKLAEEFAKNESILDPHNNFQYGWSFQQGFIAGVKHHLNEVLMLLRSDEAADHPTMWDATEWADWIEKKYQDNNES